MSDLLGDTKTIIVIRTFAPKDHESIASWAWSDGLLFHSPFGLWVLLLPFQQLGPAVYLFAFVSVTYTKNCKQVSTSEISHGNDA